MRSPDALVIGPMKGGTSWIQQYMEVRGDVCLPTRVKETHFFDWYWGRGEDWYTRHFECEKRTKPFCLEVGPSYFHDGAAPRRVQQTLGKIPIVVTLRDPIKRAWSHYLHYRRYGYTNASVQEAVERFPEILGASRYHTCLQRWYAVFPASCVHVVWQDVLAVDPDRYAADICAALDLPFKAVPSSMYEARNQAAVPYSRLIARFGSGCAHLFRHVGLYGAVNGAKNVGLKRIFFGKPGSASDLEPTRKEVDWLADQLAGEVCELGTRHCD